jgi:hypothetical protein
MTTPPKKAPDPKQGNQATLNPFEIGLKRFDSWHPGHVHRSFLNLDTRRRGGIVGLPPRRTTTAAILTALLASAPACTNGDVNTEPLPPTSTAPGPTPTSTIDPRAQPAVSAYMIFNDTSNAAQRHPVEHDQPWPPGADFTKTSFDPLRAQFTSFIWSLYEQGIEYRGTPPTPHISVKSVRLKAKPWPTVMLTDCQTGGDWDEYVIKTGKRVPLADNDKVSPPYLITIKMIYYEGHWGAQTITADKSRTCTA